MKYPNIIVSEVGDKILLKIVGWRETDKEPTGYLSPDGLTCDCSKATNFRGEQGYMGQTGEQGPSGYDGNQGQQGEQGERGPRGLRGEEGMRGADGAM